MTDITKMSDDELIDALAAARIDAGWEAVARYVRTLIPAAQPVARVPVAMASHEECLTVACNDGTIWWLNENKRSWVADLPIPQTRNATPAPTIPDGWTLWADEAPTARCVEWRYLNRGEVDRGQPGNFENTEGVLWRPLPDTPSQAEAPASTTKPDALMDDLLAAVMDCGNLLSGIVAKEDDASKGAYQPGKAEHLRVLAMCERALELARAEGRT